MRGVYVAEVVELLRGYSNTTFPDISLLVARDPGRSSRNSKPPRRVSARLSDAQVHQLCAEYQQGSSTRTLAARFGISKTTVSRLLHEEGVPLRHQGLGDNQRTRAAELYAAGSSVAQVASTLGFHPSSVYDALRAAGVAFRPAHAPGRRKSPAPESGPD